jgi:RNA polymerase sigma factor (sigma-70 family)
MAAGPQTFASESAGMARVASESVVRQLGSLFDGGAVAGLSDRQLLERFTARHDACGEAAFAALVSRHGPMVLAVCRQLLGDRHLAEDAFQAVFLVLARKAPSVRGPDLLGNWLYGVALRTARCAKVQLARRRRNEGGETTRRLGPGSNALVDPTVPPAEQPVLAREQSEALHREIERLPRSFRLPIVLCYFEGLTLDEAARRLRCPAGTVGSRLARARDKLRRGLTRRGMALPSAALAVAAAPKSASAAVSSLLGKATTQAALRFAAGPAAGAAASASATALAQEVLRSMLIHKLRLTLATWLALAAGSAGVGYLAYSSTPEDDPMRNPADRPAPVAAQTQPRVGDRTRPAAPLEDADRWGRMTVTGRVLNPVGQPAADVPVDIVGRPRALQAGADERMDPYVRLGGGVTDADGRFRLEAVRSSSARHDDVCTLAAADGSGLGCAKLNPDAEQPTVEIRLRPEQVIHGRLVDVNGQPAAGVEVRVHSVYRSATNQDFEGLGIPWMGPPEGLRAWPRPVTTDEQGRFALAGIGRGLSVTLYVDDPRFARQKLQVQTDDRDGPKDVSAALQPATIIEGRALTADTGQPIPGAVIAVDSVGRDHGWFTSKFRADDQGRFRVNPYPGESFRVRAHPRAGQPYPVRQEEFAWTKGAVKKEIDLKLPRGVLIRGRAIEEGTGRPVAGARVHFFPTKRSEGLIFGDDASAGSQGDGSFQVAVPPRKGHLLVLGPTLNYVPKVIGGGTLYAGAQPGGLRFYAHDIIAYEVKAGDEPHELTATLRPGKIVRGRLVGPEGKAVEDAVILTRQQLDPTNLTWRGHGFIHARGGRFEVYGLDPEQATPVYFLDAEHQWGMAVELSGKQADEEMTVQLQPCGQASARFVGPDSQPVANLAIFGYFELIMTPGPNQKVYLDRGEHLVADAALMPNVDPKHYNPRSTLTDAGGRITLPALIPGALYRISDWSTRADLNTGAQIRKDFTVQPGETLDLGEILVEKPQDLLR